MPTLKASMMSVFMLQYSASKVSYAYVGRKNCARIADVSINRDLCLTEACLVAH